MVGGISRIQKIVNPAFKEPPPRNPTPIQTPEWYKRELMSLEDIHLVYDMSSEGKRRSNHWLMRADYPQHTHTTLCRIYRVKIRPDQFEQADGSVIPEKSPKQCIVYSLSEFIDDPEFIAKGGPSGIEKISGDFYSEGVYTKHLGKFSYDERGNIKNSEHLGTRNMFYIEYSPEKILELLSKKRQYSKPSE